MDQTGVQNKLYLLISGFIYLASWNSLKKLAETEGKCDANTSDSDEPISQCWGTDTIGYGSSQKSRLLAAQSLQQCTASYKGTFERATVGSGSVPKWKVIYRSESNCQSAPNLYQNVLNPQQWLADCQKLEAWSNQKWQLSPVQSFPMWISLNRMGNEFWTMATTSCTQRKT